MRNLENPPPSWITFDLDAPVLAFTVLSTLAAAVFSGLLPALMSSRANAVEVLRDGGRGNTSRSVNLVTRGLVVFQIVVTCVLLVGSLLQLRSITNQQTIDYGYDTGGIISARMGLMDGDYPTPEARRVFYDRLLREFDGDPQFEAVALTNRFRMVFSGNGPIEIEGKQYRENRDRPNANFEQVTGGFFAVTGQKLLEGRTFTADDLDTRQPVAIVNAASRGSTSAPRARSGRRFRTVAGNGRQPGPWRTIVGVVSTVRMLGPFNQPERGRAAASTCRSSRTRSVRCSRRRSSASSPPSCSSRAAASAPTRWRRRCGSAWRRRIANLPLYFVGTPKAQLDGFVAQNRIIATMFSIFGVVAMVLASVGMYGVMSFSVNQRRQEFGVRMALGAQYGRILQMVLRQGAMQLALGLFLGLGLALALATPPAPGFRTSSSA